jgi:SAM-dependent methyltransferase
LLKKLKEVIDSPFLHGDSILDYGCGDRPYESLFAAKFKNYVAADIAGNPKANFVIGANGQIPTDDETFDCVFSSQVLEHVVEPQLYLREAHRVLKQDGTLIVSTHGIWPYHPDPTDFWRWTIDGLQREVGRAGFEILMVKGIFGLESTALQLWQDATFERLPRFMQPLYTWFFQTAIGFIESRRGDKTSDNASVYIVLARRQMSPSAEVRVSGKNLGS